MFDILRWPGREGRRGPAAFVLAWSGMSKRYREQVHVTDGADGDTPVAFLWRGSHYRVLAVLGHWREDAGYWSGGEIEIPQRDLWRVEAGRGTRAAGVYELVREAGTWRLDRVWD
jgi:hypothetical protein